MNWKCVDGWNTEMKLSNPKSLWQSMRRFQMLHEYIGLILIVNLKSGCIS